MFVFLFSWQYFFGDTPHVDRKCYCTKNLAILISEATFWHWQGYYAQVLVLIAVDKNHLSQWDWCFLTIRLDLYIHTHNQIYDNVWMCLNIKYVSFLCVLFFGGGARSLFEKEKEYLYRSYHCNTVSRDSRQHPLHHGLLHFLASLSTTNVHSDM